MKVIERLHEVLGASTPARQLGDEDGVDLSRLGQSHNLLALNAVVLGAGRGLLEHGDDAVASPPGERPEIAFLALAGLVVSADPAVDGDLSQLNPRENRPRSSQEIWALSGDRECII